MDDLIEEVRALCARAQERLDWRRGWIGVVSVTLGWGLDLRRPDHHGAGSYWWRCPDRRSVRGGLPEGTDRPQIVENHGDQLVVAHTNNRARQEIERLVGAGELPANATLQTMPKRSGGQPEIEFNIGMEEASTLGTPEACKSVLKTMITASERRVAPRARASPRLLDGEGSTRHGTQRRVDGSGRDVWQRVEEPRRRTWGETTRGEADQPRLVTACARSAPGRALRARSVCGLRSSHS